MMTVAVLFGGRSGEHNVSRRSAASVFSRLDRKKYNVVAVGIDRDGRWYPDLEAEVSEDAELGSVLSINRKGEWSFNLFPNEGMLTLKDSESQSEVIVDIVFPVLHGTFCEDGTLQGALDLAAVPYIGSGVVGSAVGMDKDITKRLLKEAEIPVVPWITVKKHEWAESKEFIGEDIKLEYGFPCFVKPANAGSSVGISKAENREELYKAVETAFQYDTKILIEKAVDCREIECAVLGHDHPRCSVLGEVIPLHDFYSYEAKYIDKNGADLCIPAELDEALQEELQRCAVKAFHTLELSGMSRIDFFIDEASGEFYLNEVNTLPGFTSISMYPKLWEASGIEYSDLLDYLIDLALQRFVERKSISYEY